LSFNSDKVDNVSTVV